jgi:hypothetical protein
VTESGVSHCHFQVTETSNPLSIVGPHTFEKNDGREYAFYSPPLPGPAKVDSMSDLHQNVTPSHKSLVRLYQQSIIRSNSKSDTGTVIRYFEA